MQCTRDYGVHLAKKVAFRSSKHAAFSSNLSDFSGLDVFLTKADLAKFATFQNKSNDTTLLEFVEVGQSVIL